MLLTFDNELGLITGRIFWLETRVGSADPNRSQHLLSPISTIRVGDKTIGPFLLVAFQTRYKEVLIKAHTAASVVPPKYLTLLTNEETKLYEAGQSSTTAFKKWRMGGPRLQKAAVLGRKRKPTE